MGMLPGRGQADHATVLGNVGSIAETQLFTQWQELCRVRQVTGMTGTPWVLSRMSQGLACCHW
ncbi:hypothetical protein Q427_07085 [Halomonas sp. BC04]|nr:hypothetical protein Q427_07085 [Halomonas sp. BC04]